MKKSDYLGNECVRSFSVWLADRLCDGSTGHQWASRKNGETLRMTSLVNAVEQYSWRFRFTTVDGDELTGNTYEHNTEALSLIERGLRSSVTSGEDKSALAWSLATLEWGGVTSNNKNWLTKKDKEVGLADYLSQQAEILAPEKADDLVLEGVDRFNAAMTKIYSFLLDDFIIYDSRVAAAIALMVRRYCVEKRLDQVPELLGFRIPGARQSPTALDPTCRNPSEGGYIFTTLTGAKPYAKWNLRASWLLADVLDRNPSAFSHYSNRSRALEAALFMVGYDVGPLKRGAPAKPRGAQEESCSFPISTRGDGIHFRYALTEGYLKISTEKGRHDQLALTDLVSVLKRLHEQFEGEFFPLANNVEKLHSGSEQAGLGRFLYEQKTDVTLAQAASYFGPALEDLGLLEWNGRRRGICWRLLSKPPFKALGQH